MNTRRACFQALPALAAILVGPSSAPAQSLLSGAPNVCVSGSGFTVQTLREGGLAFGNRSYVWGGVPAALQGWQYTQTDGGRESALRAVPKQAGFVYAASSAALPGWEAVPALGFHYTDKGATAMTVYCHQFPAGAMVPIPQLGWTGTMLLAPALEQDTTLVPGPAPVPGVVVAYSPASSLSYIGSPSLVILPNGDYVASHDLFGPGSTLDQTRLFVSQDRGRSWARLADLKGQYWSSLFLNGGRLYLLGTSREFGDIVIRRSGDGGRTWTTPADAQTGLIAAGGRYHCAPVPVVVHDGRLWRAMERLAPGVEGRHFLAFVLSAPLTSDLLRAKSWTLSRPLDSHPDWPGDNWLEGNAVVTPQHTLVDILRVGLAYGDRAAIVHISADGAAATFDPAADLIDFPGGGTKFTIRYDPVSRRYWSLVNPQKNPPAERNILALTSSADLRHWTVASVILHDPDRRSVAFQYVDWQFDGGDIVAVSRTAFGGAHSYHDANYLTFHRIPGFRSLAAAANGAKP